MDRKDKIFDLLLEASEKGFSRLFEEHKEHFYYCSLVMMDEATPCITAMSEEVFTQFLDNDTNNSNSEEENENYYKWAYAESPYLGFGYDEFFTEVNDFFNSDLSDEISDDEYERRINDWLIIMRDVMKALKDKGVFINSRNENVFLNAGLLT